MIKKLVITLSMLVLCVAAAPAQQAQEKKESGLSSWLRELQKKIDVLSPRRMPTVTTGAAGVRGAKDDSTGTGLYWKGKENEEPVTEGELQEFRKGLALAEAGKRAESIHELEEFMRRYPDSALIPDAKKTTDLMKAEAAAGPAGEPAAPVQK